MQSTSLVSTSPHRASVWADFRLAGARRPVARFGLAVLGLALFASPTLASSPPCNEGSGPAKLELFWDGLDKESSVIRTLGTSGQLWLRNNSPQWLFVDVSASAVLDAQRETQVVGTVAVPGLGSVSVPVDFGGFGVALANLDFAGRVSAKAVARNDQGAPVSAVAYAPPVFFHDDVGRLYIYRERALLDKYGAGDYADRATKLRKWIADRGLHLAGISYFDPDLPLTDDDGGPPTDDPTHQRRQHTHPHPTHHHHATSQGSQR